MEVELFQLLCYFSDKKIRKKFTNFTFELFCEQKRKKEKDGSMSFRSYAVTEANFCLHLYNTSFLKEDNIDYLHLIWCSYHIWLYCQHHIQEIDENFCNILSNFWSWFRCWVLHSLRMFNRKYSRNILFLFYSFICYLTETTFPQAIICIAF